MIPYTINSKQLNEILSRIESPVIVNCLTRWYTGPNLITVAYNDIYQKLTEARVGNINIDNIKKLSKVIKQTKRVEYKENTEWLLAMFRFGHIVDQEFQVLTWRPSPLPQPFNSVNDFISMIESGAISTSNNIVFLFDYMFAGSNYDDYISNTVRNVVDRGYYYICCMKQRLLLTADAQVVQHKNDYLIHNVIK